LTFGAVEKGRQPGTRCFCNATGGSLLGGLNVFTRCIPEEQRVPGTPWPPRYGLAWDKARLAAPGLGGVRKEAFLNSSCSTAALGYVSPLTCFGEILSYSTPPIWNLPQRNQAALGNVLWNGHIKRRTLREGLSSKFELISVGP